MSSVDNLYGMVQFFALAIVMVAVLVIWASVFDDENLEDTVFSQTTAGSSAKSNVDSFFGKTDNILFFGYFAIHLGILVLAFMLRTHPILYLAGFLIILVMLLISPVLSNVWNDVIASDALSSASADVPKTDWIMDHLPLWELVWGILTAIITFGLARYEGGL